jgi:hypothetical protein
MREQQMNGPFGEILTHAPYSDKCTLPKKKDGATEGDINDTHITLSVYDARTMAFAADDEEDAVAAAARDRSLVCLASSLEDDPPAAVAETVESDLPSKPEGGFSVGRSRHEFVSIRRRSMSDEKIFMTRTVCRTIVL